MIEGCTHDSLYNKLQVVLIALQIETLGYDYMGRNIAKYYRG